MQMNLTSFNIPSEVCKHISSTCLVGSLKICRSTQIWDLMNSSHYNKIWKKSTLCIPALQVHIQYIFLNRKFASKHKIHHFQIDTIFNPANRRKEFTVLFFFYLQCITLLTQIVFDTCIHKNKLMTMYRSRINIWRCPKPPGLYNTVSNNKKTLILYIKRNRFK